MKCALILAACGALLASTPAAAQNLYAGDGFAAMASDRRATAVGDTITVVVSQVSESSNTTQNNSRKGTDVSGSFAAGGINESADLRFGGGYSGRGEVRRSERLLA